MHKRKITLIKDLLINIPYFIMHALNHAKSIKRREAGDEKKIACIQWSMDYMPFCIEKTPKSLRPIRAETIFFFKYRTQCIWQISYLKHCLWISLVYFEFIWDSPIFGGYQKWTILIRVLLIHGLWHNGVLLVVVLIKGSMIWK